MNSLEHFIFLKVISVQDVYFELSEALFLSLRKALLPPAPPVVVNEDRLSVVPFQPLRSSDPPVPTISRARVCLVEKPWA